ncbi:MAG: hypothetical protein KME28_00220 [Pelatocladus maniniholoensis HA4357-MV3]|uniref:Uncharacterized protein n=1 Tax=Pelatocladus maniniholoensis HA4357-MV3 TaxID=1117104 RepID=A0A9E3H3D4_9NOST|nr:hypothetical protein [Pelatocladus maniniholoensis HA4357-MV3]
MSENKIEYYGKGYLVLLLPISFLIIFLVATWRIWLALIFLGLAISIWQRYQWQKWCLEVNPMFNQLIRENEGKITPMDLAIKGNFSGETAKRYLDTKVAEFAGSVVNSKEGGKVYYFITAGTLGSIFDSSEPVKELPHPKNTKDNKMMESLLAPPPSQPQQVEPETETPPQTHQEEVKQPLEQQLIFGSLIQSELAKRLNVYSSTVYKRRDDPNFSEWSRSKDPDGIAWSFSPRTKEFFPLEEQNT